MKKVYLAVDLGAGSGRVMAAAFDGKKLSLEEVARWSSNPVKIGNSYGEIFLGQIHRNYVTENKCLEFNNDEFAEEQIVDFLDNLQ